MMNGNGKSASWYGKTTDEEEWILEIEHDCFSEDEEFVVTLYAEQTEPEGERNDTLCYATPEQARQMAMALMNFADLAEEANQRMKERG